MNKPKIIDQPFVIQGKPVRIVAWDWRSDKDYAEATKDVLGIVDAYQVTWSNAEDPLRGWVADVQLLSSGKWIAGDDVHTTYSTLEQAAMDAVLGWIAYRDSLTDEQVEKLANLVISSTALPGTRPAPKGNPRAQPTKDVGLLFHNWDRERYVSVILVDFDVPRHLADSALYRQGKGKILGSLTMSYPTYTMPDLSRAAWVYSTVAEHGWGPLLYDAALAYHAMRSEGLSRSHVWLGPDRGSLSAAASKVWRVYYEKRDDVDHQELPLDSDMMVPTYQNWENSVYRANQDFDERLFERLMGNARRRFTNGMVFDADEYEKFAAEAAKDGLEIFRAAYRGLRGW